MSRFRSLLNELKRRRVFRVAAVYAVVAFVVLQAAELLVPALLLPSWVFTLVALLAILGFPIALVLAWAFELTPAGIRRAEPTEETAPTPTTPAGAGDESPGQPRSERSAPGRVLAYIAIGILVAGGAYGAYSVFEWPGRSASTEPPASGEESRPIRSLAVLPFADLSPQGDQRYFSDGLAEELLDALARVPQLDVKARSSSFQFRGASPDVRMVGDSLGVEAVLEGSVRKAGDRVKITVQLVSAEDASHLWSRSYERRLSDIFEVQEEIARRVVEALRVRLDAGVEERLAGGATDNLDAYSLYLQGRHVMRTDGGPAEAAELYREAIALDPTFARAHAGLAGTLLWRPYAGDAPGREYREGLRDAETRARKALELDPDLAEAHTALALVLTFQHEWDAAERHLGEAVRLNPNLSEARGVYMWLLAAQGRFAEALEQARIGQKLDPLNPPANGHVFEMLTYTGRYEQAERQFQRVLDVHAEIGRPTAAFARSLGAMMYARWGRYDEAIHLARTSVDDDGERHRGVLGAVLALSGEQRGARAILSDLKERAIQGRMPLWIAMVHSALAEPDSAFRWLERLDRRWSPLELTRFRGDPWWEPIRRDPRYTAILERAGVAAGRDAQEAAVAPEEREPDA